MTEIYLCDWVRRGDQYVCPRPGCKRHVVAKSTTPPQVECRASIRERQAEERAKRRAAIKDRNAMEFPYAEIKRRKQAVKKLSVGPGSELKRLLNKFFIHSKKGCDCDQHAKLMDMMGPDWCQTNIEVIIGWLQKEASKRHMPFVRKGAEIIIRKAIYNSRKKLAVLEA